MATSLSPGHSESTSRTGTHAEASLLIVNISWIARLLRIVSTVNYILLVYGTTQAAKLVGVILDRKSPAELPVDITLLLFLSYPAWIGWRNIGNLRPTVWPTALALLIVAGTEVVGASFLLGKGGDEAVFAEVWLVCIIIAILSAAAVQLYVMRMTIPHLNVNVRSLLRQSTPSPPSVRFTPRAPIKGIAYMATGLALLALLAVRAGNELLTLLQLGNLLIVHAKQFLQPRFGVLTSKDKRAPVLFLRSFLDEENTDLANFEDTEASPLGFSLELRLATHFRCVGPFIAVNSPKNKAPHPGAVRADISDQEWQATVTQWIKESAVIVLMAGISEGASWELKRVLDLGQGAKLIIVFPELRKIWWKLSNLWDLFLRDPSPGVRLDLINSAFEGTSWEPGLSMISRPDQIRSLVFDRSGRVTAITSGPKNADSYHLAALIGHYVMRRSSDQENASARSPDGMPVNRAEERSNAAGAGATGTIPQTKDSPDVES